MSPWDEYLEDEKNIAEWDAQQNGEVIPCEPVPAPRLVVLPDVVRGAVRDDAHLLQPVQRVLRRLPAHD